MNIEKTTPVPNMVLDAYLMKLHNTELKVLLVIIRQTYGWIHPKNPRQRKEYDRITIETFVKKTGCSRRSVSSAIDNLIQECLIDVLDYDGNKVLKGMERKGKSYLYYKPKLQVPVQKLPKSSAIKSTLPVHILPISKETNQKKENTNSFYIQNKEKFNHITQFLNQLTA